MRIKILVSGLVFLFLSFLILGLISCGGSSGDGGDSAGVSRSGCSLKPVSKVKNIQIARRLLFPHIPPGHYFSFRI